MTLYNYQIAMKVNVAMFHDKWKGRIETMATKKAAKKASKKAAKKKKH